MKKLRRIIIAGLLVWLPLGITVFIIKILIDLLSRTYLLIPEALRPENLFGVTIPGFGIIMAFIILFGTGLVAANFLGKTLVETWEKFLEKIPLVRSIYAPLKTFAELVLSDQTQSFSKVLLIQYPRKGLYSLCFQTSKDVGEIQEKSGVDVVCVFIPTTPNPTSGYIILIPKDEVIELDMSVEDALKMIISLGVVVPTSDIDLTET
ncbi:MAG TPA: DUF502 domain-containing protein [Gammaproteobacteria bacterium]|jgi:uncharacterized membrane protein|nr:DUF502 domain-containing protein [Gammaproteobacteria bacterium]HIK76676.1 DUF502 domain-containing protein [Gammaproteobacteria bacterium]